MPDSYLFYDLETFGIDPRKTRIAQFAAIRTDTDLNPIEDPIDILIKPADDLLPSPEAALVTGITPQYTAEHGLCEADAFARIHDALGTPNTCVLGYNSLRFDDEFIRYGLFRNLYDPYEREWRGGNSRWDLLDVMRLAYALRPDGLAWPMREDEPDVPSFRLEHLAELNQVRIGDAHEALSDVRALIGLAKKFKQAQPRLWEYASQLRSKRSAARFLNVTRPEPVLHISQRYPAAQKCAAMVMPISFHPSINNRVIVFDLNSSLDDLIMLDADAIRDRLYTPRQDLPDGVERVGLKEVHLNRSPMLVSFEHLRAADFERLAIDPEHIQQQAAQLRDSSVEIAYKVRDVFSQQQSRSVPDVDASLYDGFIDDGDKRKLHDARLLSPQQLAQQVFSFDDPRLPDIVFRYRARNWPDTLNQHEHERWQAYRQQRFAPDSDLSEYSLDSYFQTIQQSRQGATFPEQLRILDQLEAWGLQIKHSLD